MNEQENSKLVEIFIKTLVEKISRRTSESYAVVTLNKIINKLTEKYEFLKNIDIKKTFYSEGIDAVTVYPNLNQVDKNRIYQSINEIIKFTIEKLEENADYFFIREFNEAFDKKSQVNLEKIGLDLKFLQNKYIVNKMEDEKINKLKLTSEMLFNLSIVLNKILSEKEVIKTIIESIENLKVKYDFLKLIRIQKIPDSKGFYNINVNDEIEKVYANELGDALQQLIQDIFDNIEWKGKESFVDSLKKQLGNQKLNDLKKIGLNFDKIQIKIDYKEHEKILKKSLQALIQIVGEKTSIDFATLTLNEIIKKLDEKHEILKYVEINTSDDVPFSQKINVSNEINTKDSYLIGKAIRDIIKRMGHNLGNKTHGFIENFKREIGDEYLDEIEKIGVNLHFLELKFI